MISLLGNKHFLGKKHSDETRKKISIGNKGKNLGRKHTFETRLKLSKTRRERYLLRISKINKQQLTMAI